ncbi:hypothetical protein PIB30_063784 [Stylosanthes scabra]|uniref:Uncharacterized protein n=1 Tax=Stylosanthes scabra TaxID=79078 RepID=A0ABU6RLG7_9FABA|nr:hypothetical protein [Stylosanthes scabra]
MQCVQKIKIIPLNIKIPNLLPHYEMNFKSKSPFGHGNHNRSFSGDSINHGDGETVAGTTPDLPSWSTDDDVILSLFGLFLSLPDLTLASSLPFYHYRRW